MSKLTDDQCPFGPEFQNLWSIRTFLLSRFDEARVDATGLHTITPEPHALDIAARTPGVTVLDVCCGVGGNTIAFARAGKQVVAFDRNSERVEMARHNAGVYGVASNIEFHNGSAFDDRDLPHRHFDTVFIDPPWGNGVGNYKERPSIRLEDFTLNDTDLRILAKSIQCENIVMRFPANFEFSQLISIPALQIVPYHGLDGRWIYSCLFATKQQFVEIPRAKFLADPTPA